MKKVIFLPLFILLFGIVHAQVPAYVAANNLISWYPFNGNAHSEVPTLPPGLFDATVNGATLTTDRFGVANSAYWLNGDTDNITIDTAFFWVAWGNYSISCWINSDTLNNPHNSNRAQAIFNTIPHNGLALYFNWNYSGKYEMFAGSNPPTSGWDILSHKKSNTPSTTHAWKHLVMVKRLDSFYSIYVNGVLDTTYKSYTMGMPYYCKLVLGRSDPGVISEGFSGKIDDYGIWHRALSQCEITRLYKSTPYLYITTQPTDTVYCGSPVHVRITDTGAGNTYQWQINTGGSFANVANGTQYSGVTSPTLTITYLPSSFWYSIYRCVVVGAACTDTSALANVYWCEAVNSVTSNQAIDLLPNPTTGDITIAGITNPDIRVYNILGQLVKSGAKAGYISIAEQPKGIYVVQLLSGGNIVYTGRVLKE